MGVVVGTGVVVGAGVVIHELQSMPSLLKDWAALVFPISQIMLSKLKKVDGGGVGHVSGKVEEIR